ncbi:baseplate assembly protein V [Escherichia coli]|nr:baseplate assembly protein V [Escherichia coli]
MFRYDTDAGALSASGMKTATLQASVSVTLDTPVVECTDLLRTATLDVTKGGKMSGNITHSGGDFTSNASQCIRISTVALKVAAIRQEARSDNPLHRNESGRDGNLNDMEHLKQSVRDILITPLASRLCDGNMAALCLI